MAIVDDLLQCFGKDRLHKARLDQLPSALTAFELLVLTETGLPSVEVFFQPQLELPDTPNSWSLLVLGTAVYDEYRVHLDLRSHAVLASAQYSDDREPKLVNSSLENFLQFLMGVQKVIDAKVTGTFSMVAIREYEWLRQVDTEGVKGWWEPFLSEMLMEANQS